MHFCNQKMQLDDERYHYYMSFWYYYSSTAALVQKLAKENDDAAIVLRKTEDIEHSQSLNQSNRYFAVRNTINQTYSNNVIF